MMSIIYLGIFFASVLFCCCQCSSLVINIVEVGSTEDVELICNVSSATNMTRWTYLSGYTGTSLIIYQNGRCTVSPSDYFLSDRIRYSYTCNSTVYQVVIHADISGSLNNHIISCSDVLQPEKSGSTWMIKINQCSFNCTPCTYCEPQIIFNVQDITEGNNVTFICRVSSNAAYVNWNKNIGSNTAAMGILNGQCTTQGTTFLNNTTPVTSVTVTPDDNIVSVIENTAVVIKCKTSISRPAASVNWYRHPNGKRNETTQITENINTTTDYNDLSVITSTLHFVPQRQHTNTRIYCTANNSVNINPVKSNKKMLLNVQYKAEDPYILQGNEYRVIENTLGTLSCSVRAGIPTSTLSWSCNLFSPTNQSTIGSNGNVTTSMTWNVSRRHEGKCTCTSTQTRFMTETIDVSIVVVYEVSIVSFSINGLRDYIVTVDEGTAVIIKCITEGNPIPEMTLTNGTNVLVSRTSRHFEYNLSKVSCQDIGTYSCSARNELNVKAVVSSIDLIVHCSPRPIGDMDEDILSGIGLALEINIEVIEYPVPSFRWWSQVNDQWKLIQTTDRRLINSSELVSSLIIKNVNEDDFTSYKVVVGNSVGNMEHLYKLRDGSPDMPTKFQYFETLSTSSSIQLAWDPGYNGGSTQIFFIKYKSTNESSWKYQTVSDDLEQTRIYTLTNLNDNMYYYIKVLASNQYGNSSESSLLIANTKEKETTEPPTQESSNLAFMIGGIVGGVIALVAVLSVAFCLIRRRMSSKSNNGCKKQPDTCQQTESVNQSANEPSTITQYDDIERDNEYEMINQDSSPSKPYSSLQEKDNMTQAEINREDTYENTI